MEDRALRRLAVRPIAALLTLLSVIGVPAAYAGDASDDVASCLRAVGTFLTIRNIKEQKAGTGIIGRSLISLTNGGHALFTDSAQSGLRGYQPFSDARGAWSCATNAGGKITFKALLFDFTFPTTSDPTQRIARIDIKAEFDPMSGQLTGHTVVSFAPLAEDPFGPANLQNPVEYDLTGKKIVVPHG